MSFIIENTGYYMAPHGGQSQFALFIRCLATTPLNYQGCTCDGIDKINIVVASGPFSGR